MNISLPLVVVTFAVSIQVCEGLHATPPEILVFEGTVASIELLPLSQTTQKFLVTMRVNRVVKGEFHGKTFQFLIHSPALAGLNVGDKHVVEAKRVKDGYVVDPYQWNEQNVPVDSIKPIVAATFTEGKELVITPDPQKLQRLGLTIKELDSLRRTRIADEQTVHLGGKTFQLTDVATVTERDLEVKPFTVTLADGREVTITPNVKIIAAYLIPGWEFEENVRTSLANPSVSDPGKIVVLANIRVPGGKVPNYWTDESHIHMSTGEPLEAFAKVEVRVKPVNTDTKP